MHGEMVENRYAQITRRCWEDLPNHYPHITLDAFAVMPDHVHGIIVLSRDDADVIARTDPYEPR
jgi:putative transposase